MCLILVGLANLSRIVPRNVDRGSCGVVFLPMDLEPGVKGGGSDPSTVSSECSVERLVAVSEDTVRDGWLLLVADPLDPLDVSALFDPLEPFTAIRLAVNATEERLLEGLTRVVDRASLVLSWSTANALRGPGIAAWCG